MLFTHFYVMQEKKIETWFVSIIKRQYHDFEPVELFFRQIDNKTTEW